MPGLPCNNPEELLLSLASLCEDNMGGSSGVVSYTIQDNPFMTLPGGGGDSLTIWYKITNSF